VLLPAIPLWRRTLAVGSYAAVLITMHQWLPDAPLFYQASEEEVGIDVETVYYRQQAMLDAALVELRPQTPGQTDLYFVGMAAYAGQDVFMREVLAVRRIVEQRLGLSGRTLTLINNKRTVDDYALANRHNLARVAAGLGHVMDVADDVAVLFVTSHGYEDSSLAVEFEGLGLNDIDAEDIRASFAAAGIRYRIIIISACYSGGFIDRLQSPDSIVITASARDRSSFGCGAHEDWTYFGQAFFADALLHTTNFVTAFEQAARAIKAREESESKQASQPQIWVGEHIAQHLKNWRPATTTTHSVQ
jgi:Peptidase C13 family